MKTQVIITNDQIKARLQACAATIATDFKDKDLLILGILKGCVMVIADLTQALWKEGLTDSEVSFMTIQSYGSDTESSKNPQITQDTDIDIRNRHVLLVEDIVDTGHSLAALHQLLQSRHPKTLKTFVLLSKNERREVSVDIDYTGFEVQGWVEGYGMDTDQKGRGRPDIIKLTPTDS